MYALEAVLILDNGIVLPVLTEILDNKDWIEGETKQDCERKAFKLRKIFGKGNDIAFNAVKKDTKKQPKTSMKGKRIIAGHDEKYRDYILELNFKN